MSELKIKFIGTENNYSILSNKVKISERTWDKSIEYFISFDNLGFDIIKEKTKSLIWVSIIHFSFMCLNIYVLVDEAMKGAKSLQIDGWLFSIILFASLFIYSLIQKTEKVYLTGGNSVIILNASNPNSKNVYSFINELHLAMRNHFKSKFGNLDLPIDNEKAMSNFLWLKEINAINENEYQELIHKIGLKNLL